MQPISSSCLFCQINVAILLADKRKSMKIVIRITVIFEQLPLQSVHFFHGGAWLNMEVKAFQHWLIGYLEFCNFNDAYSLILNQKGRGRAKGTVAISHHCSLFL